MGHEVCRRARQEGRHVHNRRRFETSLKLQSRLDEFTWDKLRLEIAQLFTIGADNSEEEFPAAEANVVIEAAVDLPAQERLFLVVGAFHVNTADG
jgi:hypothetical protein